MSQHIVACASWLISPRLSVNLLLLLWLLWLLLLRLLWLLLLLLLLHILHMLPQARIIVAAPSMPASTPPCSATPAAHILRH